MQAWDKFVELQEAEIGPETAQKWLKSLKVARFDACNLYLEAKDAFQANWFEEHMREKVMAHLVNNNKRRIKVHLSVANGSGKKAGKKTDKKEPVKPAPPSFALYFDELNPFCTFQNLVISKANALPAKLLSETALPTKQNTLGSFNPIYVYGPKGSGKTHLLMATAAALKSNGISVVYSRAQTFTDHVVGSIRQGEMSNFRHTYRNSDVLIIDDVHLFSKKGATQEEFFHTFNTLHIAGKQIILSASCAPSELKEIEPRLVSRFEWGIVLGLTQPEKSTLMEIISKRAESLKFPLHQKVVEFLLESFTNCTSIIQAVEALVLRSHMKKNIVKSELHLTVPIATDLLADLLQEEEKLTLTPIKIVYGTAEYFGIKPEDVLGKTQTRECVLPRQISMHLCRHQLKMPFAAIGEFFDRDHSTVMFSVKRIQEAIEKEDKEIAGAYRLILSKVREA